MKQYATLLGIISLFLLCLFGIAEMLKISQYIIPGTDGIASNLFSALVGLVLLVSDVVLPIPASLIMIAFGARYGVAVGGLLSAVGSIGASMVAFYLGRYGGFWFSQRLAEDERLQANAFLAQWGEIAVIVSRPIPILAESLAILAGVSKMSGYRMFIAAVLGSAPNALVYASVGGFAITLNAGFWIFGSVFGMCGLVWIFKFIMRYMLTRNNESRQILTR